MLNSRRTKDPFFNCTVCEFSKWSENKLRCSHESLKQPGVVLPEVDQTYVCDYWVSRQDDENFVAPREIPESMKPLTTDQMHDFVSFITHSIKILHEDPRIDWDSVYSSHLGKNVQALVRALNTALNALLGKGYEYKLETMDHRNITGKVDAVVLSLDVFKTSIQRP